MRRALLVLPLLLVTACSGGGDDGGSGPSLEDRRAAYLEDAEAVCKDVNAQVAALGTPTSIAAVPDFADKGLALVRSTVERFSAVQPPEEDRAAIEKNVTAPLRADLTTAEKYVADVKAAAAANDGPTLLRLVQERPQTTARLAYMREYGFSECVKAADQKD